MFTTLDKDNHARRKRIIADRYANSNIVRPEPLGGIAERAAKFSQRCAQSVGGYLDIYVCFDPDPVVLLTERLKRMLVGLWANRV
jgi:hypothetical protein